MSDAHPSAAGLVWYAAYGSNLSWDRFRCYLRGGRPAAGDRTYPGSRDGSDPRDSRRTWLPYGFRFSRRSTVWGGGVAFVDPRTAGWLPVRLWLITAEQFADVFAQENRLDEAGPVRFGDQESVTHAADSWYGSVVRSRDHEAVPVLTFTAATPAPPAEPTLPYLQTMAAGLAESHGWSAGQSARHLSELSGMERWSPERLEDVL